MELFLSKSSMPILRYVALLLGWLMNGIYEVQCKIGLPNVGLAIVMFTIIVYLIMTPVQYKTQKSSKIMAALNPELQKIQKKYKGRRDQYSMQKMQEETQALYARYGVSMSGSCLPMLIQLPLLLSVYQVILYIPGYINKIREIFEGLAAKLMATEGAAELITTFASDNKVRVRLGDVLSQEKVIDFLYALKPAQWTQLQEISQFSALKSDMVATAAQSQKVNYFLGINISEAPWDAIKNGFFSIKNGEATGLIIIALLVGILIPVLAWFTQWLNYKLMPQQTTGEGNLGNSMQTMNTVMPVFSAFICLTLSMGVGIYWIIGAVIRCVQQIVINRKIGKIDIEEIQAKAQAAPVKAKPSRTRTAEPAEQSAQGRSIASRASRTYTDSHGSRARNIQNTEQYYTETEDLPANSITAKANLVRSFDAKNAKKNSGKKK